MDRVGANFQRTVDMIANRFNANPVPIQLPVGQESEFTGVVDLLEEKALIFSDSGETAPQEGPVPAEMQEDTRNYRARLVEKIAETDDVLMGKYLDEEGISIDELRQALRRATIRNDIVPVLCGTALKNKGIHPLLDAIGSYLPSPMDVPEMKGIHPKTGEEVSRAASDESSFSALAFKVMADPHVGRLVYVIVYSGQVKSGSPVYNSSKGEW